jgi:DNA recombination protein RmuC
MINLFSLEILIGLMAGILIGWVLKNIFSKKENVEDLASNLKSLEKKIDGFQTANDTERGSIKTILQDIKTGEADVVKAAEDIKKTLVTGGSQNQGSWGELVLTRILTENLQFTEGEEFEVHKSFNEEDGRKIPDVIIHFPDGRDVIVDSKVSLKAWDEYVNATDEREKEEALERHKLSLKTHIDTLAKKNYQGIKGIKTIDTVVMFCPNESAISILPRQGGSKLFEYAIKNKVTLASPSIFYYMLKTAEYSWKADKQSKNVAEIINLANLVSAQAVDIYGSAKKAQEAIANTSDKVSEVMEKIKDGSGSFLSRIKRMNKLGLTPKKQIPIAVDDDEDDNNKTVQ